MVFGGVGCVVVGILDLNVFRSRSHFPLALLVNSDAHPKVMELGACHPCITRTVNLYDTNLEIRYIQQSPETIRHTHTLQNSYQSRPWPPPPHCSLFGTSMFILRPRITLSPRHLRRMLLLWSSTDPREISGSMMGSFSEHGECPASLVYLE